MYKKSVIIKAQDHVFPREFDPLVCAGVLYDSIRVYRSSSVHTSGGAS